MRTVRQTALALLVAALCALACAPAGSASNLSVNAQTWKATFSSLTVTGSSISVNCPATLEGEFEPLFATTVREVSGAVYESEVSSGSCRGGRLTVLHETLPANSTYVSFTGTLPRFTSFTFAFPGLSYLVEVLGVRCLYRSTSESPAQFAMNVNERGEVTGLSAVESVTIPLSSGEFTCPTTIRVSGTGTVTVLETGGTYRVTVAEAGVPLPSLYAEPRIAAVPPRMERSKEVRIYNRENSEIRGEEVTLINNTAFRIFANSCEGEFLGPRGTRPCSITTLYERPEAERPRLATIRLRYRFGGVERTVDILTFARKP